MSKFKFIAAILLAGALAGCQTVQSNITAFHTLEVATQESFSVRPAGRSDSLEAASYAAIIADKLAGHGWTAARAGNIEVVFDIAIDGGRTEFSTEPVFGETGGGRTYTTGRVIGPHGSAAYSGTSYTQPTFGVVGSRAVADTVYTRTLIVEMFNKKSGKKIYESRVTSKGVNGSVSAVAPCMIVALFKDFPGQSGKSRTVELNSDSCAP